MAQAYSRAYMVAEQSADSKSDLCSDAIANYASAVLVSDFADVHTSGDP